VVVQRSPKALKHAPGAVRQRKPPRAFAALYDRRTAPFPPIFCSAIAKQHALFRTVQFLYFYDFFGGGRCGAREARAVCAVGQIGGGVGGARG